MSAIKSFSGCFVNEFIARLKEELLSIGVYFLYLEDINTLSPEGYHFIDYSWNEAFRRFKIQYGSEFSFKTNSMIFIDGVSVFNFLNYKSSLCMQHSISEDVNLLRVMNIFQKHIHEFNSKSWPLCGYPVRDILYMDTDIFFDRHKFMNKTITIRRLSYNSNL